LTTNAPVSSGARLLAIFEIAIGMFYAIFVFSVITTLARDRRWERAVRKKWSALDGYEIRESRLESMYRCLKEAKSVVPRHSNAGALNADFFDGHELAEFVDTGIFRVNLFDTDLRTRPYETRYVHARDFSLKSFESHDATPQRDYL